MPTNKYPGTNNRTIVYILGTFPLLSQTFVRREILTLVKLGVQIRVIAVHKKNLKGLSEEEKNLIHSTIYLPQKISLRTFWDHLVCIWKAPGRYCKAVLQLLFMPHRSLSHRSRALSYLPKLAPLIKEIQKIKGVRHLHAHFASWQTEVALAAGRYLQLPVSFTGHAKDIYRDRNAIQWKINKAKFVITCTEYNRKHLVLENDGKDTDKIFTVYHPIDPRILHQPVENKTVSRYSQKPMILAVGRLVPKKGFIYLIEACRILRDEGASFSCFIVGGGSLWKRLIMTVERHQLSDIVKLVGSVNFETILKYLQKASIFVVPSIILPDGDRDGIPNVLIEAMAMKVPPIATNISGLPEIVVDHQTGLLVPQRDSFSLAKACLLLLENDNIRKSLGESAMKKVLDYFSPENTSQKLEAIFRKFIFSS
jgi:glycosyltransferase involved in cell wall biosynthesis